MEEFFAVIGSLILGSLYPATVALIVILIVRKVRKKRQAEREAEQRAITKIDMCDPVFQEMVDETVEVLNDFLESGPALGTVTRGDYEGFIQVLIGWQTAVSSNTARYNAVIVMHHVPELLPHINAFQTYGDAELIERKEKAEWFERKYGRYFNPKDKHIEYHTQASVILLNGNNYAAEGRAMVYEVLRQQIKDRCPLVCGNLCGEGSLAFHTKKVPY